MSVRQEESGSGRAFPLQDAASAVRFRALLDNVSDMVAVSDRDGGIVYANAATERASGYAPEEFASLDPFDLMHPEDRPRFEAAFERLASAPGLSLELEQRVRHKDGTWRWVEATFRSFLDNPEVGVWAPRSERMKPETCCLAGWPRERASRNPCHADGLSQGTP